MGILEYVFTGGAFALQIAIIAGLLRGHYRKYPFLLALIVLDVLGSVVSLTAFFDVGNGKWTRQTAKIYWMSQGIQYALVFACQIHMLYCALRDTNRQVRVAHPLIGGIIVTALSVWVSYDVRFNFWMTQLARNFCFASIFLNLTLWTSLLRSFDRERLMITASLGFLLIGGAIGHSLRQMSRDLVFLGNIVLVALYLLYLFTLWRTVRAAPVASNPRSGGEPVETPTDVATPTRAEA